MSPLVIPEIPDEGHEVLFSQAFHDAIRDHSDAFCVEPDCGQPAGTVCTYALCPGKRRSASPFHSQADSAGGAHDHVIG